MRSQAIKTNFSPGPFAQWLEQQPSDQRISGSIPSQVKGTYLRCRLPSSHRGVGRRQPMDGGVPLALMFLSPPSSFPSTLSRN